MVVGDFFHQQYQDSIHWEEWEVDSDTQFIRWEVDNISLVPVNRKELPVDQCVKNPP